MGRKLVIALVLVAVVVLLPVAGTLSAAWWMVGHPSGTAWLLTHVPRVQVSGAKGALRGDFEAQRIEFDGRPVGMHLVIDGFGWRGLRLSGRGSWSHWRVAFDDLHAARVELDLAPSTAPLKAPKDLTLPFELEATEVRVGELRINTLGDKPLRDLKAHLHLGADDGANHRVDALSLVWDKLRASGAARIDVQSPMKLDAALALTQDNAADTAGTTAWSAQAHLAGPLEAPLLTATLRAQPMASRPAQSLDASATLRPFAAWPLGDLNVQAKALDLAAFHSAAPTTALTLDAVAKSSGLDQPLTATLSLSNSAAGRWNEGRLPLRQLKLEGRGRPDDTRQLELQSFDAELGTAAQSAGRVQGKGRWTGERWSLDSVLSELQPSLLDARAAPMRLSGPLTLAGSTSAIASVDAKADLSGRLADKGPARAVQLAFDASASAHTIELRSAQAQAGGARASLAGSATRSGDAAPWHVLGKATLVDFDPLPWWPGREDSPLRRGPHKLNATGEVDLVLPQLTGAPVLAERLAALRGQAHLNFTNSLLAGVPLQGDLELRSAERAPLLATVNLDAAGNTLHAEGKLSTSGSGADDAWDLRLNAAALERLAPLWAMLKPGTDKPVFSGALNASARVLGRWPVVTTQGQLDGTALRVGAVSVQKAQAKWQMGSSANDPVDAQATLTEASSAGQTIESLRLDLKGTAREHRLDVQAEAKALPPAWTDSLQTAASASTPAATRTLATLQAQGGVVDTAASPFAGWRGSVSKLELKGNGAGAAPWIRTQDVMLDLQWAGGPPHATLQPGRAEVLGGALRWSRLHWQAADGAAQPAQIELKAELETFTVAPLLARWQPDFGWGGDLAVGGHIDVRSAPNFSADIVLERARGDLSVTDETGKQALELTDLRLALTARDGVWTFTQGLAGKTLGAAAGAVVANTSPSATWPPAATPISGVLELQVANLGTWGTWVPAGWRLGGALRTSATIGGRFGAPEYTGVVQGTGLSVRNFLQGVNVSDGEVAIALQGSTARIDKFTARAGAGTLKLEGNASLGDAPKAQLKLVADKFQLLGRVDRRIIASGTANLQLDRTSLALDGEFGIDEGLIDFSRSDAPVLADDVEVVRAKPVEAAASAPPTNGSTKPARTIALNLKVGLGQQLRLRGRGIDTGLRGELRLTAPGGRLAVNGTVSAQDGTYAAYGQKLSIDRGLIAFNGPAENPRLDIEATRPNIDTRVGVIISGTAQNPRIRLFSEPEVSDMDKLSWLVLGRASDGLGRADTALLQRAAVALLSGEGEDPTDQFTRAIGLDEVSLRQSDGDVRETVISLGKQLSRRWYVGYERGLNATTGSWQLIYRIAQRFTLRAQSGLDNSLDLIWTWRWQ